MKRIFILEDHTFYASEIVEYLSKTYEVVYAQSYKEAEVILKDNVKFDFSILDVILKNGKTGIDIVNIYHKKLGDVLFLTGCIDNVTIGLIEKYKSAHKMHFYIDDIVDVIEGKVNPKIEKIY
jgi:DNA-binding response OmpR family regulator